MSKEVLTLTMYYMKRYLKTENFASLIFSRFRIINAKCPIFASGHLCKGIPLILHL